MTEPNDSGSSRWSAEPDQHGANLVSSEGAHAGCFLAVIASASMASALAAILAAVAGSSDAAEWAAIIFCPAFFVALIHALVFGLPLYHVLRWAGRPGLISALFGGLAVGGGPSLILGLFLNPPPQALLDVLFGGADTPEVERLGEYLLVPLLFAACGFAGGLAFWAVALRRAEP